MSKAKINPINSELGKILNDVGIPYFLMSVSHLYDAGYRNMTDESVKETIEGIKKRDDKGAIMTNDFMIFLVETAYKLSKIANPLELAKFVSKYVNY
jgi:hypothetical protein